MDIIKYYVIKPQLEYSSSTASIDRFLVFR